MSTRFHLFVSAGPDLDVEREVIGRVVAALPVQLGWEIKRTPPPGKATPSGLDVVARCDLFFLIIGHDISAPVGVEWDTARRSGRRVVPLVRRGAHTPAANIFLRETRLEWQTFESVSELERLVRAALVDVLLERAIDFRLTPEEWEALNRLQAAEEEEGEESSEPPEPAGAGGGGVILGPDDATEGGVLIEES
ncbi:MAG TPA: hypothetical protein G4O02_09510 [Caldilineae bacterium]|jgi:hypothetical protein|nr:hypothetical protein [Caldilineae bacterium]